MQTNLNCRVFMHLFQRWRKLKFINAVAMSGFLPSVVFWVWVVLCWHLHWTARCIILVCWTQSSVADTQVLSEITSVPIQLLSCLPTCTLYNMWKTMSIRFTLTVLQTTRVNYTFYWQVSSNYSLYSTATAAIAATFTVITATTNNAVVSTVFKYWKLSVNVREHRQNSEWWVLEFLSRAKRLFKSHVPGRCSTGNVCQCEEIMSTVLTFQCC